MSSSADASVTPRPCYLADRRKLPDIHTKPAGLRDFLRASLGQFLLFSFWGPAADVAASRWIADAAVAVGARYAPTITLVYLPHLDYVMQRVGPMGGAPVAADLVELDGVLLDLIDHCEAAGAPVIVLNEYGISVVDTPVHINWALRAEAAGRAGGGRAGAAGRGGVDGVCGGGPPGRPRVHQRPKPGGGRPRA